MAEEEQLESASSKIDELRADLALLRLRLALRSYDPEQPRVPAGSPSGGRWTPNGSSKPPVVVQKPMKVAQYDASREPECNEQAAMDAVLCRMSRTDDCWGMINERRDNCLRGVYVPPLRHTQRRKRF